MSGAGHNSTAAGNQLRAFVERVERIEEEIRDLNADKSEIYKEVRGQGFDVKTVRKIVAARKLDANERDEADALFDLYWVAVHGSPDEAHVHVHAHEKTLKNSAGKTPERMDPSADHVSPPARTRTPGSGSANEGGSHVTAHDDAQSTKNAPYEGKTSLAAREGEKAAAPHSNLHPTTSQERTPALDAAPGEAGAPAAAASPPSSSHVEFKPASTIAADSMPDIPAFLRRTETREEP